MSENKGLQSIAYDYLRDMIYARTLEFDKVYSETRLAKELSISRTPMREALCRLSQERYIDILPNRGFRLHTPDTNDLREAYHVRMMIECYCGELLSKSIGSKKAQLAMDKMRDALERQKKLLDEESNEGLRLFWQQDQIFHFAPLQYVGISAFKVQYDTFLHIFMPQFLTEDQVLGRKHSTVVEHRSILDAMNAGDINQVRKAIAKHLDSSMRLSTLNAAQDSDG